MNTWIQGYRIQGYMNLGIHRYIEIQGYMDTGIQGCRDKIIQ